MTLSWRGDWSPLEARYQIDVLYTGTNSFEYLDFDIARR
jgi:hypothetical protein